MKNLTLFGIIIIILSLPSISMAEQDEPRVDMGEEIRQIAEEQLNNLDIHRWEEFLKGINGDRVVALEKFSPKKMVLDFISGRFEFDWKLIFNTVGTTLFNEVRSNLGLMIKIIAIALIAGILDKFKSSFNDSSVGELAWIVCYIMIVVLIVQSITITLKSGEWAIEQMTRFMQILFPILLALLISMGAMTSSGILQPATALLSGITGSLLKNIMIPLIFLSAVLVMVGNLNHNLNLGRLSKLVKNLSTWILGIIFTIFVGVLSIQGILAASFDGISIRTAKYAIEAFVPVVGKLFSQTVDILIGCSVVLKNAVGVAGLMVIIGICLLPIIKIISLMAVYKLSSALLEPVSDKRIVDCLDGIGSVMIVLFITVAGIAIMFFMTIALLIGLGNTTVMMR